MTAQFDDADIRSYYDRHSAAFVRLGQGRGSLHRAVWGAETKNRDDAFHYIDDQIAAIVRPFVGRSTDVHVVDLGCGTGALLPVMAPHVAAVIGVDASDEMLTAARHRAQAFANVDLRRGALEALPIESASLDAAVLMLVLHHVPSPVSVLAEAHRVLKPSAPLLIVDMAAHEREEYRQRMGHVWLGFSEDLIRRFVHQAGFDSVRIDALEPAAGAKGPALFAAIARKESQKSEVRSQKSRS